MCLFDSVPVTVKTPRKVYKILLLTKMGYRVTPFEAECVNTDMLEGRVMFKANDGAFVPEDNHIGPGYIHVYSDLESAAYDFYTYFSILSDDVKKAEIYECEIPVCNEKEYDPDLYCWEGLFDGDKNIKSVAVREIRFIRLVPESEVYAEHHETDTDLINN